MPACMACMAIHARAWVVVSTITPSSFSLSIMLAEVFVMLQRVVLLQLRQSLLQRTGSGQIAIAQGRQAEGWHVRRFLADPSRPAAAADDADVDHVVGARFARPAEDAGGNDRGNREGRRRGRRGLEEIATVKAGLFHGRDLLI